MQKSHEQDPNISQISSVDQGNSIAQRIGAFAGEIRSSASMRYATALSVGVIAAGGVASEAGAQSLPEVKQQFNTYAQQTATGIKARNNGEPIVSTFGEYLQTASFRCDPFASVSSASFKLSANKKRIDATVTREPLAFSGLIATEGPDYVQPKDLKPHFFNVACDEIVKSDTTISMWTRKNSKSGYKKGQTVELAPVSVSAPVDRTKQNPYSESWVRNATNAAIPHPSKVYAMQNTPVTSKVSFKLNKPITKKQLRDGLVSVGVGTKHAPLNNSELDRPSDSTTHSNIQRILKPIKTTKKSTVNLKNNNMGGVSRVVGR